MKPSLDQIKRELLIYEVTKGKLYLFIFKNGLENREDISITEFSDLLYFRFGLIREQAMKVASFIFEKSLIGAFEIEYDPNLKLKNK